MIEKTTFGARLKEAREARGLTLKQLHEKTRLSASYLSLLENDKREPSEAAIALLCAALDESEIWLTRAQGASKSTGISRGPIANLPADLDPATRSNIEEHLVNQVALFERMTQELAELRKAVTELRAAAHTPEEVDSDLQETDVEVDKSTPIERPLELAKAREALHRPRRKRSRKPKA